MKVGILGGTFDPIHKAHLQLAREALDQLKLDCVYLVLSPRSPFKLDQALTPTPLRLRMLKAALHGQKKLRIGKWELKRRGPSYTITTLKNYQSRHPKHELFLIMGSDSLSGFNKWKHPEKILKLATLVVGRRPQAPLILSNVQGRLVFLKGIFPDISATQIRRIFYLKEEPHEILPHPVLDIIRKNHLYEK